jgi:hypothetical protein
METQPGTRTALVDPFGRELEQWLRDAPTTTKPYVSDLVVPPVTGPIRRPETDVPTAADATGHDAADSADVDAPVSHDASVTPDAPDTNDAPVATAFRRDRDRGRHASACAPSFPEPPARMSLAFGDLAVQLSADTGRTTIERIAFFEQELDQRDADLARLAAWEARVDDSDDPEVTAARAFAAEAFADILADALAERTELDGRARARAATPILQSGTTVPETGATADRSDVPSGPQRASAADARAVSPELVLELPKPTPLVQPATGPNAIHRAAFEEAVRTHSGHTAEVPTVFPLRPVVAESDVQAEADTTVATAAVARPSWWSRFVARLLRIVRR